MGKIFCILGKSATGKDSLYKRLLEIMPIPMKTVITYTTRPIRAGERNGVEYFFTDIDTFKALSEQGKIIESRCFHTVFGDWYYYTVDDGQINDTDNYLMVGITTLQRYEALRNYFGDSRVVPLYIDLSDDVRLIRSIERERKQANPNYREVCRRFIADDDDFNEESIKKIGITKRFYNYDFDTCINELSEEIRSYGC